MRRFDAEGGHTKGEAGFSTVASIIWLSITVVVVLIIAFFVIHLAHQAGSCITNPSSCPTPTTMPGAGLP